MMRKKVLTSLLKVPMVNLHGGFVVQELPVTDDTEIIESVADKTARMRFDASGIDPATTRVLTIPNEDGEIHLNTGNPDTNQDPLSLVDGGTGVNSAKDYEASRQGNLMYYHGSPQGLRPSDKKPGDITPMVTKMKSSEETRTTTSQDYTWRPSLFSGSTYTFELFILHASNNRGLKMQFRPPSGASGGFSYEDSETGIWSPEIPFDYTFGAGQAQFHGDETNRIVRVRGWVTTATSGGTFDVWWGPKETWMGGSAVLKIPCNYIFTKVA